MAELSAGDSIAINGVCLTAVTLGDGSFAADAMNETLARTSLGDLAPGAGVNLELPLRAGDRLGGHVVQGHVDGLGEVVEQHDDGFARRIRIGAASGRAALRGREGVDRRRRSFADRHGGGRPIVYRFSHPRDVAADESRAESKRAGE